MVKRLKAAYAMWVLYPIYDEIFIQCNDMESRTSVDEFEIKSIEGTER